MKLSEEIISAVVPENSLRLWWLGQAGFAFKTASGKIIYTDPYLSHAAERLHGFKRLSLSPIAAENVQVDLMVFSHEHTDHLDPDAVPIIAKNNPKCCFAAPSGCWGGLDHAKVPRNRRIRLKPRKVYEYDSIKIHTAQADHGDQSPTALSLVIEVDGIKIFFTGDTSWKSKEFQPLADLGIDLILPCINGTFGNMNHLDAAYLTRQVGSRMAIPCHFWTFAEQGSGDPLGFILACKDLAPETKVTLLTPGEGITIKRKKL